MYRTFSPQTFLLGLFDDDNLDERVNEDLNAGLYTKFNTMNAEDLNEAVYVSSRCVNYYNKVIKCTSKLVYLKIKLK